MKLKPKIKIEICCSSVTDCKIAKECGADRVELIQAHQLGGLTPSIGTVYTVINEVGIPVEAIIRPRMSGFFYSEDDFKVMCHDAREFINLGVDGIVFGFLTEDSYLDYERCARFMDITGDVDSCFHRGIDIIKDPDKAIEQLIKLGVKRILTSGGMSDSYSGRHRLKYLQEHYGDKIQILAGGGITENNVNEILEYTNISQIHFGATSLYTDNSCLNNTNIAFGSLNMPPNECYIGVNKKRISNIISNIRI